MQDDQASERSPSPAPGENFNSAAHPFNGCQYEIGAASGFMPSGPIRFHTRSRTAGEPRWGRRRPPKEGETAMKTRSWRLRLGGVGIALAPGAGGALGASHREAPLMTLDPGADISDVHFFVGYDQANLDRAPADRQGPMMMKGVPGRGPGA